MYLARETAFIMLQRPRGQEAGEISPEDFPASLQIDKHLADCVIMDCPECYEDSREDDFDHQAPVGTSVAKRILDVTLSIFMLLFFLPLLILIAALIKITSPGPIIYRQKRGGVADTSFFVMKFRTMYSTSTDQIIIQAKQNDPRVTSVGSFLRRTSLDELPQLINVLSGEMSIVGPRPHALDHDDIFRKEVPEYSSRARAKPGITGLAQISGCRGEIRSVEDIQRRVAYDKYYIDKWDFWFDIKIIMRTVLIFTRDPKAY